MDDDAERRLIQEVRDYLQQISKLEKELSAEMGAKHRLERELASKSKEIEKLQIEVDQLKDNASIDQLVGLMMPKILQRMSGEPEQEIAPVSSYSMRWGSFEKIAIKRFGRKYGCIQHFCDQTDIPRVKMLYYQRKDFVPAEVVSKLDVITWT